MNVSVKHALSTFTLQSIFILAMLVAFHGYSQEVVSLPKNDIKGVNWEHQEKEYYSELWQTQVVTNVSQPSMQVFLPAPEKSTGTAVVIAPGGGLYAHSINSEGLQVAKWLNTKGIAAFVLKYTLVPTGEDGVAEISYLAQNDPAEIRKQVWKVMPTSIEDGLNAIAHIRENASKYKVDTQKIGFMGFSAGGAVTMGVGESYNMENRPDFLVPVYPWTTLMPVNSPRSDAPPMLIICASDDPLDLAKGSIALYNAWLEAEKSVGLHMYSKGGHGFGMRTKNLPSDTWIERFYEWSIAEGITEPK